MPRLNQFMMFIEMTGTGNCKSLADEYHLLIEELAYAMNEAISAYYETNTLSYQQTHDCLFGVKNNER
jgi:hypothetical protein